MNDVTKEKTVLYSSAPPDEGQSNQKYINNIIPDEEENINNFESIAVYDNSYKQVACYKCPKQISGYEYEVEACIKALAAKELECVQMPHSETIRIMILLKRQKMGRKMLERLKCSFRESRIRQKWYRFRRKKRV